MPALSPDGKRVAVVNAVGDLLLGSVGEQGTTIAHGAALILPPAGRPARVLWQPRHDALLYDAVGSDGAVALMLLPASGGTARRVTAVPALLDAAFSPDGALLLVRTPDAFELWGTAPGAGRLFQWPESDPYALPWWSPDGKTLLIQEATGIQRVDVVGKAVDALLRLPAGGQTATLQAPSLWSPATAEPWSPDGGSIVFAAPAGATWRGAALDKPKGSATGLYVASVGADSAGSPRLLDSGDDRAPAWGFADPATVFLIGAAQ